MEKNCSFNGRQYSYLTSEIETIYHEAAQKFGLSDSALRILYTIDLLGDRCPLSEIIRLSGISKQTVNSSLRRLEQDGVLYLEAAAGKKKTVCLTESGNTLVKQSAHRILEMENDIFSSWSKAEQDGYIKLTEHFLSEFRDRVRGLSFPEVRR